MKRIDYIRAMTAEEMAELITNQRNLIITDDYCKSDCEDSENFECPHEKECCIRWLNEDVGGLR